MSDDRSEPPFEGGAQPVPEHPPEVPGPGQSIGQVVVIVLAILVILAGLVFFFR